MNDQVSAEVYSSQPLLFPPHFSLRKIVEYLKDKLEWTTIYLTPEKRVEELKDIFHTSATVKINKVRKPELTSRTFQVYAGDIQHYLDTRLRRLVADNTQTKAEKIKLLTFCARIAIEREMHYDYSNPFKFGYELSWILEDSSGQTKEVPFSRLILPDNLRDDIRTEFSYRKSFFEWFNKILHTYIIQIATDEFHDSMVHWMTPKKFPNPDLCVAEIIYALRNSGMMYFETKKAEDSFKKSCGRLFNLTNPRWSELESDIRKRAPGNKAKLLNFLANSIE